MGDEAAEGKAEHVNHRQVERLHEDRDVIGHGIDRIGGLAARTRHAGVVEQDYRPVLGQAIRDKGVPVVEPAPEMLQKNQGRSGFRAKAPIRRSGSRSLRRTVSER